jgi:hypothetical protein
MTSQQEDLPIAVARILRERLEQYEVPAEVRAELAANLMNLLGRPERTKFGACVMTPEASMDGDRQRRGESGTGEKPRIV